MKQIKQSNVFYVFFPGNHIDFLLGKYGFCLCSWQLLLKVQHGLQLIFWDGLNMRMIEMVFCKPKWKLPPSEINILATFWLSD